MIAPADSVTVPILLFHLFDTTVTLQENAASAIMTQYDAQGIPAVYNCVLGADAQ